MKLETVEIWKRCLILMCLLLVSFWFDVLLVSKVQEEGRDLLQQQ
jgi:uncharacterized protein YpmS